MSELKTFCGQCDKRVGARDAARCASRHCAVKTHDFTVKPIHDSALSANEPLPVRIAAQVAEKHGIGIRYIFERTRLPAADMARIEVMARLHYEHGYYATQIGVWLGRSARNVRARLKSADIIEGIVLNAIREG